MCEFKMQVWNVLHAALWKYRTQKSPSGHHRTTLSGYSCATEAHIDNRKKLLNSSTSSTCRYNMVNFSPLASEIGSVVWGTPADLNGFRILAALLLDTSTEHQLNFAALNGWRHLYSPGQPSCWALTHFTTSRRIASAVLATAIPSVRPSVSKRRHTARCSLHCQIAKYV